ncbi:MAG: gamma-glutamyltransferase family protein [Pseudomonadota bacterium]
MSVPRPPVVAGNGMVASSQTAASLVGLDVLRRGGSAIDAAIATNAALSVVEPHMCGIGGDLFAIVWDSAKATLAGLNASGCSPESLSLETMQRSSADGFMPGRGPLAITTPGAVAGWFDLHERFGRLPMSDVLSGAIALAEDGVAIGFNTNAAWSEAVGHLRQDSLLDGLLEPFMNCYTTNAAPPKLGGVFRNQELANSLRVIGNGGRGAFYEGPLAEEIAKSIGRAGGYLNRDDLANCQVEWVTPVSTRYRGVDIFELPPNGQGLSVLQMLNILEQFPLHDYTPDDPRYWHLFLEAKKLAFEDRAAYFADPAFYSAPTEALIAKDYAQTRAGLINPAQAMADPRPGEHVVPGSDTTYLSVCDADGLMVSLIQSIYSPFGSGIVPEGLGFALQSRAAGFNLDPTHPNCYAPGKRPFHTIIPAFACKNDQPWFCFGVMGADMQPQGQVQVLCNMIDFNFDPQLAGDMPRLRHDGGRQPHGRHGDGIGITQFEPAFPRSVVASLNQQGHQLKPQYNGVAGFMGGYQGIVKDPDSGAYIGATEARLDGAVMGY